MDTTAASVRVAVRLRPMNDNEKAKDTLPVVTASTEKAEVTLIRGNANRQQRQTYNFDEVHSSFSSQRDVFETCAKPLVNDVMAGFEGTVRPPIRCRHNTQSAGCFFWWFAIAHSSLIYIAPEFPLLMSPPPHSQS